MFKIGAYQDDDDATGEMSNDFIKNHWKRLHLPTGYSDATRAN